MNVQCIICDKIDTINEKSLQAKRLINRKTDTYLCDACSERITTNTKKRHATGKFTLYHCKENEKTSY